MYFVLVFQDKVIPSHVPPCFVHVRIKRGNTVQLPRTAYWNALTPRAPH